VKKILKKKTRVVKKKKKAYFGKEAHNAVVLYQETKDRTSKNKIYNDVIKPSFEKLVENLIFIHGFSKDKEHFKVLKCDCVSFLFEILEKFDPKKGSKAFSYFNVCAKNFLIIRNKKNQKNKSRHVSIDDESLSLQNKIEIENFSIIPSQEDRLINKEDKNIIFEIISEIKNKTSNNNELSCLNAINTLFQNIENLELLNKRAVFVYLRELSSLNAKQLSIAMSNIRKNYKEIKNSDDYYFLFVDGE
jgi:hypothetical protein